MGQVSMDAHPAVWSGLQQAYSLTFTEGHVSVWRAEKSGSGIRSASVYEGPADMELEGWRKVLRDMVAEQSAGQALVSTALSSNLGFVVPITTPLISRAKALRVMPGLLDLEVPFPVEQCRFALLDVHTTGAGGYQALAAGARERDIAEQCECWNGLKVSPSLLDQEALVLWDQWGREQGGQQPEAYQALLHVHADRSILMLGTAAHIHAVRNLHQGADSPADRFKPALLRMLRGQEEVSIPQAVWISGRVGEARLQELRELFREEGWPSFKVLDQAATLLERGTARRALMASSSSINLLLPDEQPASLRLHRQRRSRHAGLLAGLCGLLMFCAGGALKWGGQERLSEVESNIRQLAMVLTGYASSSIPRGQEVLVVSRALEKQGGADAPLLAALQPSLAAALQQITAAASQRNIQLQEVKITGAECRISGAGTSWDEAETFLKDLAVLGRDLGLRRLDPTDIPSVAFVLSQRETP